MKFLYFRLKGYIGIYAGMHLDEIVIPFDKFKNKLIVIQGDNGLGKSTIIDSLTFDVDSSACYRNGCTAEKEIHATDGTNLYIAKIISSVNGNGNRASTRAFFSKNGEELNPTGNITSYKEVFSNEFNIDPVFAQLSSVSSENKGIVDKTPAERKKYVSYMIESLDFYNNAYKNLSKKSTVFKSHINTLSNKIYAIGDSAVLQSNGIALDKRIQSMKIDIESIKKTVSKEEARIQILDPDSKIQDLYQSIYDELTMANSRLKQIDGQLDKEYRAVGIEDDSERNIQKEFMNTQYSLNGVNELIIKKDTELKNKISEKESTLHMIDIKQSKLDALRSDTNYDDLLNTINAVKSKLEMYETEYTGIDRLDMSSDEIRYAVSMIQSIKRDIISSRVDHELNIYESSISMILSGTDIPVLINTLRGNISNNNNCLTILENKRSNIVSEMGTIELLKNRPSTCNIDDCYFIRNAIENSNKNLDEDLDSISDEINGLIKENSKYEDTLDELFEINGIVNSINNILNTINSNRILIAKFKSASVLMGSVEDLLSKFPSYSFNELEYIDRYITYADIIDDYKDSKNLLITLNADLKVYESQISIIEEIINELDELNRSSSELIQEIDEINRDISFNKSLLVKLTNRLDNLQRIIDIRSEKNTLLNKKDEIRNNFEKIKDDIKNIKVSVDTINSLNGQLEVLENEINPMINQLESIKYSLTVLSSYQEEISQYKDKYDKVEFLRECCSPSKGIQTLFMSIYMNKTIDMANEMLSNFFGGELRLSKPIINSNEFRIPFIGDFGIEVDDISRGSTAQRSMMAMVLSFVLLIQGSDKYNVIRMDEIDGGLDTNNRIAFTPSLYVIMDMLNIEQCITISHSIELDLYNVSIIQLTKYGLEFTF